MNDHALAEWVRHYASLTAALALAGVLCTFGFAAVAPQAHAASTIVVGVGTKIAPINLGPIAETVFQSSAVYGPAMETLGLEITPQRFKETAELRPIPETNTLLVIGRAGDPASARAISSAAADALVGALNTHTRTTGFTVFSGPQPFPEGASLPVRLTLGGTVGFWVGLIIGIVHSRWKKPVLSLTQAVRLSGADVATTVDGRWRRGLGVLRPRIRWRQNESSRVRLIGLCNLLSADRYRVDVAGVRRRQRTRMAKDVTDVAEGRSSGTDTERPSTARILLAHVGASQRDLTEVRTETSATNDRSNAERTGLVWVR